jgi:FkbM family methyltransferase
VCLGRQQPQSGILQYMDMHPRILKLFWGLKVSGLIHAGAHKGEEASVYKSLGFGTVTWIEAIPKLAEELAAVIEPPSKVINATLWSSSNQKMTFKVATSSGSSSLFELKEHKIEYPQIEVLEEIEVSTQTLDQLNVAGPEKNLLVLDLQGAEYDALLGAKRTLAGLNYIICEVNRRELYKGIKLVDDLDKLLKDDEFIRVATRWTRHGWGEALYLRVPYSTFGRLSNVWLQFKIFLYWLWLHIVEIPLVYIRSK